MKIPVGPEIGCDVDAVTVSQLEAACERAEAKLCEPGQSGNKTRTLRAFVRLAREQLRRRKFPAGSYTATDAANRALRDAAEVGHLIAPSTQTARVLDGTAIIISALRVDMTLDTFASDDDPKVRVPGKAMLTRIANELGVSWDASLCHRTDNQESPYLRSCVVGGTVREFDGSRRGLEGQAEIDLNHGSALERKILARFGEQTKARIELARRREFIFSHVDTTAQLRAIRKLGLRDGYLPTELEKPFFIARAVFTGESKDPEARQVFAQSIAGAFLPAADALFGPKKVVAL